MAGMNRLAAILISAVTLAATLGGCTPTPRTSVVPKGDQSISVNGVDRTYTLAGSAAEGVPLLVVLHGAGLSGRGAAAYTGMTELAKTNGFLVAYPDGTLAADIPGELSWNAGECCGAPARDGVNDVAFIAALIDDLGKTYPIDQERVYLAGFSNGGMLSYQLACNSSVPIAGIAVVGAAFNAVRCSSTTSMPVLIIHGKLDTTVPFDGGETSERVAKRFGTFTNASVDDAVRYWTERNACSGQPDLTDDGIAEESRWVTCAEGSALTVDAITAGTHVWPTVKNENFAASERIAEFFELVPSGSGR
jgi:polyhydroxybutyrate depolymerase